MATNFAAATINSLKEYYLDAKDDLLFSGCALLSDLEKKQVHVGGSTFDIPVWISDASTRSATIATAATLSTTSTSSPQTAIFKFGTVDNHAWTSIEQKLLKQAQGGGKGSRTSFFNLEQQKVKGTVRRLSDDLARGVYGSGFGELGTILSNDSSKTITLTRAIDTQNFVIGDNIVFAANASSSTLRVGGALIVTQINNDSGTITFNNNLSTITSLGNGDVLFALGDRQDSATPTALKMNGLAAHGPTGALSVSDSFGGVNRNINSLLRFGLSTGYLSSPEDAIRSAVIKQLSRNPDWVPNKFYCSWDIVDQIQANLEGSRQRLSSTDGSFGFKNIELITAGGPIEIVGDRYCPRDKIYGLNLDTLFLGHLGDELIELMTDDGISATRGTTDNNLTMRWTAYSQLGCYLPGANCVISLS